ncbi:MAG: hypothetical protein QM811_21165 [Pirellulales bacterium]
MPGWIAARATSTTKYATINTIDDLKGLKIRMMGNPIFVDTMNALGGNGVAMGMDQVDERAADRRRRRRREQSAELRLRSATCRYAKHYSLTEHLIIPEILVFSRKTFDALSKEDQALILKIGKEAQLEQRKLWDERVEQAHEEDQDYGVNIIDDQATRSPSRMP